MAEDDLVPGEGWISDDSSFYGDDYEQEALSLSSAALNNKRTLYARKSDLNTILAHQRATARAKRIRLGVEAELSTKLTQGPNGGGQTIVPDTDQTRSLLSSTCGDKSSFLLDRKAMEQERLARTLQRPRERSPEPKLWNPGQGQADSWQMGESAEQFVRRLPPLTTSALSFPWIWAHNPRQDTRDVSQLPNVEEFVASGRLLLEQSSRNREEIRAKNLHGPKSSLTRMLDQESKALKQRITDLAWKHKVLSGKWMLFPSQEDVSRVWKVVVEGVTTSRLGPTAKVATDDGSQGDRLICVYTKDFRDEEDVGRILQELNAMGLLSSERTIYYKTDAYTYLDLYKQTASEYGLQASLYNSYKMLAAARLADSDSGVPKKKQATLNSYFQG